LNTEETVTCLNLLYNGKEIGQLENESSSLEIGRNTFQTIDAYVPRKLANISRNGTTFEIEPLSENNTIIIGREIYPNEKFELKDMDYLIVQGNNQLHSLKVLIKKSPKDSNEQNK